MKKVFFVECLHILVYFDCLIMFGGTYSNGDFF